MIYMMNITDKCKGCHTYNDESDSCSTIINDLIPECPCRDCIIKTMCQNECEAFYKLTNSRRNDSLPLGIRE
jgi:hypothetical protein